VSRGVLRRIVEARRTRLAEEDERMGLPAADAGAAQPLSAGDNPFLAALADRRERAIIAEVKMGSPRLGSLAGRVDPRRQARLYAEHGAAALSVVVEPDFFGGSYSLLQACREASGLPALAKDFIVDELQIEWALRAGASAVLLVAALMDAGALSACAAAARRRGLAPLVEVHGEEDLAKLHGAPWELVGVNNRDLATFEVDLEHALRLSSRLPVGAVRVAESGIRSGADVARLRAGGFDAFLIGESLLLAADPATLMVELMS
jgi:indole-3-glycerol phosphate synthase